MGASRHHIPQATGPGDAIRHRVHRRLVGEIVTAAEDIKAFMNTKKKAEKKRENLRMAQQQQLDVLQNELLKIRQADECVSNFTPALIQSAFNVSQPQLPQQLQQSQQHDGQLYPDMGTPSAR